MGKRTNGVYLYCEGPAALVCWLKSSNYMGFLHCQYGQSDFCALGQTLKKVFEIALILVGNCCADIRMNSVSPVPADAGCSGGLPG